MGIKIKVLFFILICLLFGSQTVIAEYNVVRVGITDNKFQNVLKQEITVYGTSECEICDKETRKVVFYTFWPGYGITIKWEYRLSRQKSRVHYG